MTGTLASTASTAPSARAALSSSGRTPGCAHRVPRAPTRITSTCEVLCTVTPRKRRLTLGVPPQGAMSCITCPDVNHTSGAGSQKVTDCVCSPGFSGVPGINCSACPADTFKATLGNEPCVPCPGSFSISDPGTASLLNCTCAPGYAGPDGGNCT
eukprot:1414263-Rhodomonas_salina.2